MENQTQTKPAEKRGLDGTQLKWIALVTMLIDHTGAAVLERLLDEAAPSGLMGLYFVMRIVGRLAFPIYCFLLTEGFAHTRSRPRYLARLAAFALAAEVPFDMALQGSWFAPEYQNVFFTLALGLAAIWGLEHFAQRPALGVLAAGAAMLAAFFLKTDYGFFGVGLICVFYLYRQSPRRGWAVAGWMLVGMPLYSLTQYLGMEMEGVPVWALALSAVLNAAVEWPGLFSLLLIGRYNGQRGGGMPKYFFYAFYPAHLLLLWGAATLLTR